MPSEHTLHSFDTEIGKMRAAVLRMAALVERQLVRAVKAAVLRSPERAAQIVADGTTVDQLHVETDQHCSLTIARQQPIAVDLREIVAVIHMIDELERIGQEALRVARRIQQPDTAAATQPGTDDADAMAEAAAELLRQAIDAFMRHDAAAAQATVDAADALEAKIQAGFAVLQQRMATVASEVAGALSMVFVMNSVARSVAHTRHIAQYVQRAFDGLPPRDRESV